MSKILVVQPHRMLQHAFSMAFFPEHQVQVTETIPDREAVKDADLIIVDAGALREQDSLRDRELLAVQSWKTPTIWVDRASQAPAREKLVLFNQTITKEALHKAMAECLGSNVAVKPAGSSATFAAQNHGREQGTQVAQGDETVIELVDVVEEGPTRTRSRTRQKK